MTVDLAENIKTAPFLTGLAASSIVEMVDSDKEDEEDRMDTGVMQISGLAIKDRTDNRIDEAKHKVHRKWDDDMKRMQEELKGYGTEVKFHVATT